MELGQNDIAALLSDPSDSVRASVATKVADGVQSGALSDTERSIAQAIIESMTQDAAIRVRAALAESLRHATDVSPEIIKKLAADDEQVSIPILESSPILTDDDLVTLVRGSSSSSKRSAIARRETVAENVVSALIETDDPIALRTLVRNDGAEINETSMGVILDRHGDDEEVSGGMAQRATLPLNVTERLVSLVSDNLKIYLAENHDLPADRIDAIIRETRERVTVNMVTEEHSAEDVVDLVNQLYRGGKLTPSILLRAACTGDMRFLEEALGCLARVKTEKAWLLIHDGGPLGLQAIYQRAGLPQDLYPAFRAAIDVFHDMDPGGDTTNNDQFTQRFLERVLTQYEDIDGNDLEYFFRTLDQLATVH